MTKYLKCFQTHSNYNTYITGSDKILPNVSYCEDNNEVHYNPWTDPKLVCKYNITNISSPTALRTAYEQNMFKSMEIDGVLLDSLVTEYQFDTTGEHTVKYELYDETKVGKYAPLFGNITTLSSVSIPDSVTFIGDSAFEGCTGLTSVTIGNGVTYLTFNTFSGCTGLTIIKVDSGNSVYDSRNNCNAIIETATNRLIVGCKNTVIPNSVTTISDSAFRGCTGLTSITIPNGVTTISDNAFDGCTGLTSITIPNSVTSIGNSAFNQCTGLTSVTIGNSVTSIGERAFDSCTGLTSITIPNGVTSIGFYAFVSCSSLTSIKVDSGNTVYDSRNNCNAIIKTATNILEQGCQNTIIPNSVTIISNYAFSSCTGLTSVTIPNSVTTIGNNAFYNCTGLTSITSLATTAPTIRYDTFSDVKSGGTLTVPTGSTGYDVWMGTGNYYLGKYNWTKVEQ